MVLTRAEAKVAFDHVVNTLLDRQGSLELKSALGKEGFVDLFQLLSLDDETIDGLVYEDPNDSTKTLDLKKCDKAMLKIFRSFVTFRQVSGNPIADDEWITLTCAEFDAFRADPTNRVSVSSSMSTSIRSTSANKDLSQKDITDNLSLFPTMKEQNGLNDNFKHENQQEEDLFLKKQQYVYDAIDDMSLVPIKVEDGVSEEELHQQIEANRKRYELSQWKRYMQLRQCADWDKNSFHHKKYSESSRKLTVQRKQQAWKEKKPQLEGKHIWCTGQSSNFATKGKLRRGVKTCRKRALMDGKIIWGGDELRYITGIISSYF